MENIRLDPFESIRRHRVVSSNMAIDQRWQQHLSHCWLSFRYSFFDKTKVSDNDLYHTPRMSWIPKEIEFPSSSKNHRAYIYGSIWLIHQYTHAHRGEVNASDHIYVKFPPNKSQDRREEEVSIGKQNGFYHRRGKNRHGDNVSEWLL